MRAQSSGLSFVRKGKQNMLGQHWFKEHRSDPEIKAGAVYQHKSTGNVIETARVLDVTSDSLGIPHVVYLLQVEKARASVFEDRRTLGLESFSERYHETVSA